MTLSETFKKAWADVEAAGLPEHIQAAAFVEAVRSHKGDAPTPAKKSTSSPSGKKAAKGETEPSSTTDSEFFSRIEHETDVSSDDLEKILYLKDGVPQINAPKRKLGTTLRQGQVTVGTIIAVARHFGLAETEVLDKPIRDECHRLRARQ